MHLSSAKQGRVQPPADLVDVEPKGRRLAAPRDQGPPREDGTARSPPAARPSARYPVASYRAGSTSRTERALDSPPAQHPSPEQNGARAAEAARGAQERLGVTGRSAGAGVMRSSGSATLPWYTRCPILIRLCVPDDAVACRCGHLALLRSDAKITLLLGLPPNMQCSAPADTARTPAPYFERGGASMCVLRWW